MVSDNLRLFADAIRQLTIKYKCKCQQIRLEKFDFLENLRDLTRNRGKI